MFFPLWTLQNIEQEIALRKHRVLLEVKAEHFLCCVCNIIVRPPGLEPGTHGLKVHCSTN